jgi:hypothetical protein
VAEIVYRNTELRNFTTTDRWFEVVEGLWGGIQTRGEDVIIPSASGRWARNRIADLRVVRLHGFVFGTTEALHRTNMNTVMTALDVTADPANLVIHTPLYGVPSGTRTISARVVDVRIVAMAPMVSEIDAELHAIASPPNWT